MKYFTRRWASGELSDAESAAIAAAYSHYLQSLVPRLPATLRVLAIALSLHDGLVRRAQLDEEKRRLVLELRAGDVQQGYFDLELVYDDVDEASCELAALVALASNPGAEALYDEVDAGDGGAWVHRILFTFKSAGDYRELVVTFHRLTLRLTPRADRWS